MYGVYMLPRPKAEVEAQRQREISRLTLEPDKRFKCEFHRYWYSGWNFRIYAWSVSIQEADCPWSTRAHTSFRYPSAFLGLGSIFCYVRARIWGWRYLRRGGPPKGYWLL